MTKVNIKDFIIENYDVLTASNNSRSIYDWSKIFNLTIGQTRYRLDKLVALDLASRWVDQTAHDRIDYGFNLNIKTAKYCIWPHKMKEMYHVQN